MEFVEEVVNDYKASLMKLLNTNPLRFDGKLRSRLPTGGGVYRVLEKGGDWGRTVYVGQTTNVQNRIYNDLLMGNLPRHTLKRKMVRSGSFEDKLAAKEYLKEQCSVQFLEIEDSDERIIFEHFAIAVLQPQWND